MTEQNRRESIRPLPPVGRARGLLAVWQQTRREAEMRLRRGVFDPQFQLPQAEVEWQL